MPSEFNLFDLIFFVFTAIFVLTAFFRGFVKEVFALFNWAVALVISYVISPYIAKLFYGFSDSKIIVDLVVRLVVFITFFLLSIFLTHSLSKDLRKKIPPVFDKSLGIFYGLVKTLVIFGFIYASFMNIFMFSSKKNYIEAKDSLPRWFKNSNSRAIIEFSGSILNPIVSSFTSSITGDFQENFKMDDQLDKKINDLLNQKFQEKIEEEVAEEVEEISVEILSKESNEDSGYKKKDIEKMNRLIEIVK